MSYRDDISIDGSNLWGECQRLPMTYWDYAQQHTEALRERRRAEKRLEKVEAEAYEQARQELSAHGGKPTETQIKQRIRGNEEVLEAEEEVREAAYQTNLLAEALESLKLKKAMLQEMVPMELSNFQSEPQVGREARDAAEDQASEAQRAGLSGGRTGKRGSKLPEL